MFTFVYLPSSVNKFVLNSYRIWMHSWDGRSWTATALMNAVSFEVLCVHSHIADVVCLPNSVLHDGWAYGYELHIAWTHVRIALHHGSDHHLKRECMCLRSTWELHSDVNWQISIHVMCMHTYIAIAPLSGNFEPIIRAIGNRNDAIVARLLRKMKCCFIKKLVLLPRHDFCSPDQTMMNSGIDSASSFWDNLWSLMTENSGSGNRQFKFQTHPSK